MEDPQIVSAIISAQQTSIATLEAAYWTAGATVVSASLGAAGIIFAAWYAWQKGIKLHQHNNILEAKREVYLEVISAGKLFLISIKRYPSVNEVYYERFSHEYENLCGALFKALVVCETINKNEVENFIHQLEHVFVNIDKKIYSCYDIYKKNNDLSEYIKDMSKEIDRLTVIREIKIESWQGLSAEKDSKFSRNRYYDEQELLNLDKRISDIISEEREIFTNIDAIKELMSPDKKLKDSNLENLRRLNVEIVMFVDEIYNDVNDKFESLIETLRAELF